MRLNGKHNFMCFTIIGSKVMTIGGSNKFIINTWLKIKTFLVRKRYKFAKITISLLVLYKENNMVIFVLCVFNARIRSYIGLYAQNRFNSCFFTFLEKFNSAKNITMIGNG